MIGTRTPANQRTLSSTLSINIPFILPSCEGVSILWSSSRCYLVIVAHEGPPSVLGPQEAVDQHGPAHGEVEADVLLEVAAQPVTGQVIAEAKALPGNQLVYLLSDWGGQQRLQTICTHTHKLRSFFKLAQISVTAATFRVGDVTWNVYHNTS